MYSSPLVAGLAAEIRAALDRSGWSLVAPDRYEGHGYELEVVEGTREVRVVARCASHTILLDGAAALDWIGVRASS